MNRFSFITEHEESVLEVISTDWRPQVEVVFVKGKGKDRKTIIINLEEFITIKGEKSLGNKLTTNKVKEINLIDSLPYEESQKETVSIELIPELDTTAVATEQTTEEVVEINTEIELNITNDIETTTSKKENTTDDDETSGQTTLEL